MAAVRIPTLHPPRVLQSPTPGTDQGCQVYGQTVVTDHHDELVKIGINPSLKGSGVTQQYPYVLYCAPPSRSPDYPGHIRAAALSWRGEGSFLFTSSSALFDCYDNGQCDEVKYLN